MKFGRISLLACVAALIACTAPTAFAGTVVYTTTGVFGSSGTNVAASGTSTGAPSTLTFSGTTQTVTGMNQVPLYALFGSFSLFATTPVDQFSDTFTLTIQQTFPSSGQDSATATVSGNVVFAPATGSVTISFLNSAIGGTYPFGVNGVQYSPDIVTIVPTLPGTTTEILDGTLIMPAGTPVVPLPPAAWAGMMLFGLIGTGKLRRRWLAA